MEVVLMNKKSGIGDSCNHEYRRSLLGVLTPTEYAHRYAPTIRLT